MVVVVVVVPRDSGPYWTLDNEADDDDDEQEEKVEKQENFGSGDSARCGNSGDEVLGWRCRCVSSVLISLSPKGQSVNQTYLSCTANLPVPFLHDGQC